MSDIFLFAICVTLLLNGVELIRIRLAILAILAKKEEE